MQDYLSAANNKDNLVMEKMLVCLRRVNSLAFIKQRRKSEEIVETSEDGGKPLSEKLSQK